MSKERQLSLTVPQRKVLENLVAGRHWQHGASGMSQHGGLAATLASLVRRGWAAHVATAEGEWDVEITALGREVLAVRHPSPKEVIR
jgi:hypothetical protein